MVNVATLLGVLAALSKKKTEPAPAVSTDAEPALVIVDAAPLASPDALPPDALAAPLDALATVDAPTKLDLAAKSEICRRVVEKLSDCSKDAEFIAALTAGLTGAELKAQRKYLAKAADWPPGFCDLWEYDWEFNGFRDHMEQLTDPQIVASCATLGTALKAAGGLIGGEMVK